MSPAHYAAQQARERGLLLDLLKEHTDPIDSVGLWGALGLLGVPIQRAHFRQHLDYLAHKGYISAAVRHLGRVSVTWVELTPKGRDLLSGLIDDVGVLVGDGD